MQYWLLVRGMWLLIAFAVLFVANGLVIGWTAAYDVTISITSPGDKSISAPVLAWFLSVAGWLAAPAIAGAVAGVVISARVTDRRQQAISEVLTKEGGPLG